MLSSKLQITSTPRGGQASTPRGGHVHTQRWTRPHPEVDTSTPRGGLRFDFRPAAKRETKSDSKRDTAKRNFLAGFWKTFNQGAAAPRTPLKSKSSSKDSHTFPTL
jgi:hypothetical protein